MILNYSKKKYDSFNKSMFEVFFSEVGTEIYNSATPNQHTISKLNTTTDVASIDFIPSNFDEVILREKSEKVSFTKAKVRSISTVNIEEEIKPRSIKQQTQTPKHDFKNFLLPNNTIIRTPFSA